MWKVRPLLDAISKQCKELYTPHRELSIDESMIGTKCRLSFIQYMPIYVYTKWGIKVWARCDAITGYIFSFDVYTGADPAKPTHPKGLAYDVVMDLLESRLDKGHAIYMDNFYSSPQLFQDLLSQGTAATGTVCTNRKHFPTSLKPKQGEKNTRGYSEFLYHKELQQQDGTITKMYMHFPQCMVALLRKFVGGLTRR